MRKGKQKRAGSALFLSLFLASVAGCAPAATQPVDLATPTASSVPSPTVMVEATVPPGWETYTNAGQCPYTVSHPPDMEGAAQGTYSWLLNPSGSDPTGVIRNFLYISVIPDDFQGDEIIYNYDPAELESLREIQVGESKSLRDDPNTAPWFTYTRLPDTTIGNEPAQAYENNQPWEFPTGTREIRYYLQANGCTYLVGGYVDATGSNQTGAVNAELLDQILATFVAS